MDCLLDCQLTSMSSWSSNLEIIHIVSFCRLNDERRAFRSSVRTQWLTTEDICSISPTNVVIKLWIGWNLVPLFIPAAHARASACSVLSTPICEGHIRSNIYSRVDFDLRLWTKIKDACTVGCRTRYLFRERPFYRCVQCRLFRWFVLDENLSICDSSPLFSFRLASVADLADLLKSETQDDFIVGLQDTLSNVFSSPAVFPLAYVK